ncbi:thiamine diphosphokinase [Sediminispirochaeta bajacaliforniensis]|uniref:thiamine diphosphokinase n=1 Tax=Sediminispirochaeta bajacaliforniensis TaxID=148 RepID=UPI000368D393|nr:thiamine diphosphokinase [Sediminispirochaeta bajacaliforniensis]
MKRAFLFIGGEGPIGDTLPEFPTSSDMVIAADSGIDLAVAYDVSVDYAVGDFDSIKNKSLLNTLEDGHVIIYDRDKDLTDTEIAVSHARNLGCDELIVIGGGGGRVDHLLALFALFDRDWTPKRWYASFGSVFLIEKENSFSLPVGTTVSCFPVGEQACSPWSRGLKWELDTLFWQRGSFGISNEVKESCFQIGVHSGRMIFIIPVDE